MHFFLCFLMLGFLTGLLSGILGIGGGSIIVPTLIYLFTLQNFDPNIVMHLAAGTSLASIIFSSLTTAYTHHRYGTIVWPMVYDLLPGIISGAIIGGLSASYFPTYLLKTIFAYFLIFLGLRMLFTFKPRHDQSIPSRSNLIVVGFIVGVISSLLGVGGGGLLIPYLTRSHLPMRNAAGTAIVCVFPLAVCGTIALIFSGWGNTHLPALATGFVYWHAAINIAITSIVAVPIGVRLSIKLPNILLRRAFALFLLAAAIDML